MCGIVGYVLAPNSKDTTKKYLDVFRELLLHDTVRGIDSTGVAVVPIDKSKDILLEKMAVPGFDFIHMEEYNRIKNYMSANPSLVLGHNRYATRGIVNDANAHPFRYDHITLVHNGHINNFRALDSGSTSDVDSAHVAAAIAKHGYKAVLPKLDGYAILVWHDATDHTVHFARTNNRALCWMFDEYDTLWYASEHKMLEWIAWRNNLKLVGKMLAPREHYHYWAPVSDITAFKKEQFEKYVPPLTDNDSHWEAWRNRNTGSGGDKSLGEASCPVNLRPSTFTGSTAQGSPQDSKTVTSGTAKPSNNNSAGTLFWCKETDSPKQSLQREPVRYEPQSDRKIGRLQRRLSKYNIRLGELIDVTPYGYTADEAGDRITIAAVFKLPESGARPSDVKQLEVRIYDTTEKFYHDRDPLGRVRVRVASIIDILDRNHNQGRMEALVGAPVKFLMSQTCVGPNGTRIPKDVYEDIAEEGCYLCKQSVSVNDQHDVSWENGRIICSACTTSLNEVINK